MGPESPSHSASSLHIWLMGLALWLALTAAAAIVFWQMRRDAVDGQTRELRLLSLALTEEIDRGLKGAEEGLNAMREELRQGRLPQSGEEATRALHTRADLMPLVRTLWLADDRGHVLAASDATAAPDLRSFAPALDALADTAIAVSRPFVDASANETLVALAVRYDTPSGSPGGWILAALPASTLLGAFAIALPAADARMAVFRDDGVRLAGTNVNPPAIDEASLALRLASRPSMETRRFRDGTTHLVSRNAAQRYGVKVVVSRDLDAVLGSWREAAQVTAIALALLLVIMAVAVQFVLRANKRRGEAQLALQAQLGRASKLESLGTLAGGVAHDFNNVLSAIVGFGEMAQDDAPPGSEQARHLDKVLQAGARGKALVERILAFSRGGARAATIFEPEPVVEEVLLLLAASLRPGVVLERMLEAKGARVRGDPTLAFEAVMNLCTNAMEAMPEGGMMSVRLVRTQVRALRVLSHSQLPPGDYLALSVSDQGGGITAAVMEHLFEPFFTTRSAQSGTGLGLAVVHGVVTEFGGAIDVQSTVGQGARFTLYLPECMDVLEAPVAVPGTAPEGGGQRILVVDDEAELVALTEEMLRRLGYNPVGFSDPSAALEALRADPHRFAAVITDALMPRLSGTQLTQVLRQHAPQLPVILVSGYGGSLLARRAAAVGVTRVLSKPLRRADLARVLAELLP